MAFSVSIEFNECKWKYQYLILEGNLRFYFKLCYLTEQMFEKS